MLSVPESLWQCVNVLASGKRGYPQSEEEAERFIRCAAQEMLLPVLFLERNLPDVVLRVLERFRALNRTQFHRSALFDRTVAVVLDALGDEDIIVLKGADYRYRIYPDVRLRPMTDIDILIRPNRMENVARKLKAVGFREQFPLGNLTLVRSYPARTFADEGAAIDVHRLFIQESRHCVNYEEIWDRRERFSIGSATAGRLALPHAIVYHAMSISFDEHWVPLNRYLDFWLLGSNGREALLEAAEVARRWHARRALYTALRQTTRIMEASLEGADSRFEASVLPRLTRLWLDALVLPDPWKPRSRKKRLHQVWRKFNLMDNPARRIHFAFVHARSVIESRRMKTAGVGTGQQPS